MNFKMIYPKEIEKLQAQTGAKIFDIRGRGQYVNGHWPGASWYPYEEEENWGQKLPSQVPSILYCDHGGISMVAAKQVGDKKEVYSVIGGFEAMKKIMENYFKK